MQPTGSCEVVTAPSAGSWVTLEVFPTNIADSDVACATNEVGPVPAAGTPFVHPCSAQRNS